MDICDDVDGGSFSKLENFLITKSVTTGFGYAFYRNSLAPFSDTLITDSAIRYCDRLGIRSSHVIVGALFNKSHKPISSILIAFITGNKSLSLGGWLTF